MSLNLRLYQNQHHLCCPEVWKNTPVHSHSENNSKNQLLYILLRPKFSQPQLKRELDFKGTYPATFERCREQTARSHAHRI